MDVVPTSTGAGVRSKRGEGGKRRARRAGVVPSTLPRVAYERTPGAGSAPLSGTYRRHEPEKTVLHGIVREHLETFLARPGASTGTAIRAS